MPHEHRFLSNHGSVLINAGYKIVPIKVGTKSPRVKSWQNLEASDTHLQKWLSNGFHNDGVGILTKNTPAIDIDIQDEEISEKITRYCVKNFGATLVRVGKAPKRLLVFRTEEPFGKKSSTVYEDMLGVVHRIELLCDGQQFVAFGVHPETQQPYQWISEKSILEVKREDLPLLPLDIDDKFQGLCNYLDEIKPEDWVAYGKGKKNEKSRVNKYAEGNILFNAKPRLNISPAKLKKHLLHIDCDDYDDWIKIGMALYHQFNGDEEGFDLWNTWSQKSEKYDPDILEYKWRTFEVNLEKQEPVTAATILKMSRECDDRGILQKFLERYIYIEAGDSVCDLEKPAHYSISKLVEFKNATANKLVEIAAPTEKNPDKTKWVSASQLWLTDRDRKTAVGTQYSPEHARIVTDSHGYDWINEFCMPDFQFRAPGKKVEIFLKHMSYLFPKKEEECWFIDFMAFTIRFPWIRTKVTPLHIAVLHGTGRGWVVELMILLLGRQNCTKTKMSILAGEGSGGAYQDFLNKSVFCAIEEVKENAKRYAIDDKIRDIMTENTLEVNCKYGGKKTQQIFTSFFFMSNHPDALVISEEDRRFNVFSGPNYVQSVDYYKVLYSMLKDNDFLCEVRTLLDQRNLDNFNWTRPMITDARRIMIVSNRSETEIAFFEMMRKPPYQAMTQETIIAFLLSIMDGDEFDKNINREQVKKLLQHYAICSKQIRVQGKRYRPWILVKQNLDEKQIREEILKCQKEAEQTIRHPTTI